MATKQEKTAKKLSSLLSSTLQQSDIGQELIEQFNNDPEYAADALSNFLREQLKDDSELATRVNKVLGHGSSGINSTVIDSNVEEIINIAELDQFTLTQTKQVFLFRDVRQLVVAIASLLLVIFGTGAGGYYYYQTVYLPSLRPKVMTGDFNIAIAQFGEIDDGEMESSKRTKNFMQALCNYLDSQYSATEFQMDVQVSHIHMPVVLEDSQAETLAKEINANLVLYGAVEFDDDEDMGSFIPRFYVSKDANQPNLIDIVGHNTLEKPITFPANFASSQEVKEILNSRAAILTHFTRGLVFASQGNFEAASYDFHSAVTHAEQSDVLYSGYEALYLMLSYSQRHQNKYEKAIENLTKALELNPEYARAYIGLANNYLEQARKEWDDERTINVGLLNKADDYYQEASNADDKSANAFIDEKVAVGIGNVIYYRAVASQPPAWEQFDVVKGFYIPVTERYVTTNEIALAPMAGVAYYNIGYVEELLGNPEKAIEAYQSCVDIPAVHRYQQECIGKMQGFSKN